MKAKITDLGPKKENLKLESGKLYTLRPKPGHYSTGVRLAWYQEKWLNGIDAKYFNYIHEGESCGNNWDLRATVENGYYIEPFDGTVTLSN